MGNGKARRVEGSEGREGRDGTLLFGAEELLYTSISRWLLTVRLRRPYVLRYIYQPQAGQVDLAHWQWGCRNTFQRTVSLKILHWLRGILTYLTSPCRIHVPTYRSIRPFGKLGSTLRMVSENGSYCRVLREYFSDGRLYCITLHLLCFGEIGIIIINRSNPPCMFACLGT